MDLKIEYMDTHDLIPYDGNAKIHTNEQIGQIKQSIMEFGMNDPIAIWKNNEIIEGHGRLIACSELGIDRVPVIRLDGLTDEQRRAYALVHNKLTMNTDFDEEILHVELDNIDMDMSEFGFLDDLEDEEPSDDDIEEVDVPDVEEETDVQRGDVYQLGNHRLMCGDATSTEDVTRLMDGEVAHLVITDPPYNMAYEGAGNTKNRKSKRIMNDKMPEGEFKNLLVSAFAQCLEVMQEGASLYTFYKEMGNGVFMQALHEAGITYKQELIWVKNQLVLGGSKYQSMYEPCLMGCKDKISIWNGGRKQRSVIESIDLMTDDELRDALKQLLADEEPDVIRVDKNLVNDLHPTMKPIKLLAKLMKNSSDIGQNVLDVFGGSGSTLITAEQLHRKAYVMELDPKYVDVIRHRWEDYTGCESTLLSRAK